MTVLSYLKESVTVTLPLSLVITALIYIKNVFWWEGFRNVAVIGGTAIGTLKEIAKKYRLKWKC